MQTVAKFQEQIGAWERSTAKRDGLLQCETLLDDLVESSRLAELWLTLGWHDIRQRYRRSVIGPFWITIATLIFVGIMTFLYSALFNESFITFLPFAAVGLVIWGLISTCMTEGARVFIEQSAAIKQLPLPLPVHVLRLMWQQFVIALHNAAVIPLILILIGQPINFNTILVVPAAMLLLCNLCWISMLLGIVGARYRDVPIIVCSMMPIVFLATPVFWKPGMLPANRAWVIDLNPVANFIEVVRAPILGSAPATAAWLSCIIIAIGGWAMTIVVYGRCRNRVALWV